MDDPKTKPAEPANSGEGADPAEDIRRQNPGETTTQDLAEGKPARDREGHRQ